MRPPDGTARRGLEEARAAGCTPSRSSSCTATASRARAPRCGAGAAAGFTQVSTSHDCSALIKLVARGDTAVVDAYLSPILRRYADGVAAQLAGVRLRFMQSNGGLTDAALFRGKDAILSGPAGGLSAPSP